MNVFKEERKKLHLTQKQLADMLYIDQTTVSKWELDKAIPDQKTLTQLADIFNVSVDYLLGRDSAPTAAALTVNEQFIQEYGSLFEDSVFRRYTRVFYLLNSEQRIYMLGYVIGVAERYGIRAEEVM